MPNDDGVSDIDVPSRPLQDISQAIALFGWMDLDLVRDVDFRRSTICYCFTLGSGAISWSSKKQPTIILSSTKVEYRATCYGTYKAV